MGREGMRLVSPGVSWVCMLLLVLCGSASLSRAQEAGPRQEVERALQQVTTILESDLEVGDKVERLRAVVVPLFDLSEMARRSLGRHWRRRTPEQREEFTRLFSRLLERTYASRITSYDSQRVYVVGEEIDGRFAQVESRIVDRAGRRFDMDYRLHRTGSPGAWRIYDVVVEDISLVNNYRAQFNRVIDRESYESLVERLRSQAG